MTDQKNKATQNFIYVVVVSSMGPQNALVQNVEKQISLPVFASNDILASIRCARKIDENTFRFIGLDGEGVRVYCTTTESTRIDSDFNRLIFSRTPDFGIHQGFSWKILDEKIAPKWTLEFHDTNAQIEVIRALEANARFMR